MRNQLVSTKQLWDRSDSLLSALGTRLVKQSLNEGIAKEKGQNQEGDV